MPKPELDMIAQLVTAMKNAIESGDWVVDGVADPELLIVQAEEMLVAKGYEIVSAGDSFALRA